MGDQNWANYKNGFGNVMCNGEADMWIGLDYMHYLTHPGKNGRQLQTGRIDINDWDGEEYWGYYNKFIIQSESRNYQLIARNFNGVGSYSIGDAFAGMAFDGEDKNKIYTKQDTMAFSTKGEWKDGKVGGQWIHDNDKLCAPMGMTRKYGRMVPKWSPDDIEAQCEEVLNLDYSNWTKNMALWGSCAQQDGAGFWYNRCSAGNLNGKVYGETGTGFYELKTITLEGEDGYTMMEKNHDDGLIWATLNRGRDYSFMMAEMRIRPRDFVGYSATAGLEMLRNGRTMDENKANRN